MQESSSFNPLLLVENTRVDVGVVPYHSLSRQSLTVLRVPHPEPSSHAMASVLDCNKQLHFQGRNV
jgi:hypothetical protein